MLLKILSGVNTPDSCQTVRLIARHVTLTLNCFCTFLLAPHASFWHTNSKEYKPKSRLREVNSVGTVVALPNKREAKAHVKSDDLQMRVGVSGQTLWAVNEGAQPDSQRQGLALHRM